jgi:hypothetical protein
LLDTSRVFPGLQGFFRQRPVFRLRV